MKRLSGLSRRTVLDALVEAFLCDAIESPVRYIGDRVAAVAAESRDAAEEAIDLIEVEYEELPAVFDVLEAMKPGAPLLHDDLFTVGLEPKPEGGLIEIEAVALL